MSELWNGTTVAARLARASLVPLSLVYALGWNVYRGLYGVGIKRAAQPHSPILVVGNLTVGGSGKSPTVVWLVRLLQEAGREVVIGCSGYGSPRAEAEAIAPDGDLDAREWGDEPAMFRDLLPEVPIVVGRRRVLAADLVHQAFPNAVLVMDDGFQHLPLRKDLSLLLEPAQVANRWCLPAGPYREPRGNLRLADQVIVIGEGASSTFRLVRAPLQGVPAGARVTAICALGQPAGFLAALRELGELVDPLVLPDHDPLTSGTLFDQIPEGLPIVVTAKDWVKLRNRVDLAGREILVARQEVAIEPAATFRDWLMAKLDECKEEAGA